MKAQLSSKFVVDYWNPEASVPGIKERNASPLEFGYFLQDLLDRAERARKDGDLPALIRFYRAVAKAVPENAKGWSKLCEAYELAKDRARAIRACRYAIERPAGDLEDYTRYVRLILGKDGPLSPEDKSELNGVLAHLEAQGTLELPVNQLRCEVGVKAKDLAMLETCTRALSRLAPDDARTVVFEWSLAVQKGQRSEARRLIERARKAGVVLESIERMEQVTSAASGWGRRGLGLLIALVILLAIGSGVYVTVRRRTLTQDVAR